jgi:type I restriction enzyme S subunit
LNLELVGDIPCPKPDFKTQHRIADYLDRETTRIDALVAAKQRALNLLAEKRKAVIAEAVTRGLDQSVPLRESGVAWLGKIPAHWEIPPIYARFEVQLGKMLDEKKISHKYRIGKRVGYSIKIDPTCHFRRKDEFVRHISYAFSLSDSNILS